MVQVIGIMIGAYIFTRMVEILTHAQGKRDTGLVLVAVVTMLVAALGVFTLFVLPAPAALR